MSGGFLHGALLYATEADFLTGTIPFIRDGLERREPVLVVEPAEKIALLRRELGEDANGVMFADMATVGTNPARIVPAWRDFVDERGAGASALRGIGEPIWAARPPDELVECQRHESLLNVAFAGGREWRLMCPYDTTSLPADVIDEARRSHAFVVERHVELPSPQFRGRAASAAAFEGALSKPPSDAKGVSFATGSLGDVRELVARECAGAGLGADATLNLVAAADELATNSVQHGGGAGYALAWHDDLSVLCEVRDRGRIANPLAGRERPRDPASPAGLWLANQLCDLVQIRSYPTGTVVRLVVRRDRRRPPGSWSWSEGSDS